jgi:hypothetical protein
MSCALFRIWLCNIVVFTHVGVIRDNDDFEYYSVVSFMDGNLRVYFLGARKGAEFPVGNPS